MYHKSIRRAPAEIYQILRAYPWPGNVRELKNVDPTSRRHGERSRAHAGAAAGSESEKHDAGSKTKPTHPPIHIGMSLDEVEREFITMTLESVAGNKAKAAAILGLAAIPYTTS